MYKKSNYFCTYFATYTLPFFNKMFPDFFLTQPKFPDFFLTFCSNFKIPWLFLDWKTFSHFSWYSKFSSSSGNPISLLARCNFLFRSSFRTAFTSCNVSGLFVQCEPPVHLDTQKAPDTNLCDQHALLWSEIRSSWLRFQFMQLSCTLCSFPQVLQNGPVGLHTYITKKINYWQKKKKVWHVELT